MGFPAERYLRALEYLQEKGEVPERWQMNETLQRELCEAGRDFIRRDIRWAGGICREEAWIAGVSAPPDPAGVVRFATAFRLHQRGSMSASRSSTEAVARHSTVSAPP